MRTLFEALDLAGLPHPARIQPGTEAEPDRAEYGELFLRLLLKDIDHDLVGTPVWYMRIAEFLYARQLGRSAEGA